MARILVLLSLSLFLSPLTAHAHDIEVEATLKAVTVYADRAELSYEVIKNVGVGDHDFVVSGFPANLYPNSLRVKGKSTGAVILGALSSKRVNSAELISQAERKINDQITALEEKKKGVEATIQSLNAQDKFLTSLQATASNRIGEEIAEFNLNADQWISASKEMQTGLNEVAQARLKHQSEVKDLNAQILKLRQDLNQLRTGQKSTTEIRLPMTATSAGDVNVTLTFQVPEASWIPEYDARLELESEALEVIQFGAVTNRTGTDWENVKLTLSTAQPHRGATSPALSPMWVNVFDPKAQNRRFKAQTESLALSADAVSSGAAPRSAVLNIAGAPQEFQAAPQLGAQINAAGLNAEYSIPGLVSIPADGTASKNLIGTFDVETKLVRQIKPQLSPLKAFLVAKATLKGEAPILAGKANLFLDGDFIGQSYLPLLKPGRETQLSFGIDDKIDVARKTLKDESGEAGLIVVGQTNTIERHFITEIQNLHGKPVAIEVLEAIPSSRDESIKVSLLEGHTTKGFTSDADNLKGILKWDFPVTAEEKREVKTGWKITWPKDKNLTGLR